VLTLNNYVQSIYIPPCESNHVPRPDAGAISSPSPFPFLWFFFLLMDALILILIFFDTWALRIANCCSSSRDHLWVGRKGACWSFLFSRSCYSRWMRFWNHPIPQTPFPFHLALLLLSSAVYSIPPLPFFQLVLGYYQGRCEAATPSYNGQERTLGNIRYSILADGCHFCSPDPLLRKIVVSQYFIKFICS
jgi:hypothetical protein